MSVLHGCFAHSSVQDLNVYTFGTSFIYEFISDRVFVYFIFNIVICVSVDVNQSEIFIFDCSLLICIQNLPDLSN